MCHELSSASLWRAGEECRFLFLEREGEGGVGEKGAVLSLLSFFSFWEGCKESVFFLSFFFVGKRVLVCFGGFVFQGFVSQVSFCL